MCIGYINHIVVLGLPHVQVYLKSGNFAIRMLLYIPWNTHTWLFGILTNQTHFSTQLYKRTFCGMPFVVTTLLLIHV